MRGLDNDRLECEEGRYWLMVLVVLMRGLDNDRLECEEGHYWLMVAGCVDERA